MRLVSLRTLKRFPTMEHLVDSGLMTKQELDLYQGTNCVYGKWWLPVVWTLNLLRKSVDKGYLYPPDFKHLMKELELFRVGYGTVMCYDWVSLPLVYTQVATVATYGYFAFSLIADQIVPGHNLDTFIPVSLTLQFIFYMGWLKVGEDLMNPFGEDDDDFEMNWILDRNMHVSYLLVDSIHGQLPAFDADPLGGLVYPKLPKTRASLKKPDNDFEGHLAQFTLPEEEMEYIFPDEDGKYPEEFIPNKKSKIMMQKLASTLEQRLHPSETTQDLIDRRPSVTESDDMISFTSSQCPT